MYNYFVSIDIAKDDHFAAVLNSSQEIIIPAFSFKYNIKDFENLKQSVATILIVCSL